MTQFGKPVAAGGEQAAGRRRSSARNVVAGFWMLQPESSRLDTGGFGAAASFGRGAATRSTRPAGRLRLRLPRRAGQPASFFWSAPAGRGAQCRKAPGSSAEARDEHRRHRRRPSFNLVVSRLRANQPEAALVTAEAGQRRTHAARRRLPSRSDLAEATALDRTGAGRRRPMPWRPSSRTAAMPARLQRQLPARPDRDDADGCRRIDDGFVVMSPP